MMKNPIWGIMLLLFVVMMMLGGCRPASLEPEEDLESPAGVEMPVEEVTEEVAEPGEPLSGTWSGNTYSNEWFGIAVEVPQGWHHLTEGELEMIEAAGRAIAEAESAVVTLLAVSELPTEKAQGINPSLVINVYETSKSHGDLKSLMDEVTGDLSAISSDFVFGDSGETVFFGSLAGLEQQISIEFEDTTIYQSYFAALVDGWMLEVIGTYDEEAEEIFDSMLGKY